MSKQIKGLLQAEYENIIAKHKVSDFIVVSTKGVNGIENNIMRGQLGRKGIGLLVVKNSLFKKALANQKLADASPIFEGTCTIVYGGESIVDAAKEIEEWVKKIPVLEIRAAFVDNSVLDALSAKRLSKLPNRAELRSQIVMLFMSPGAKLASAITSPAGAIAGCIKSIIEKAEKAEKPAA